MDDASDLRERVRELEQTVSDHQATITELRERGVSRRGVLAGGAGLGAIGLGVFGSQSASAQAAGQVGTESEPVDVEAANVNASSVSAGSVNAEEQTISEFATRIFASSQQTIPSDSNTRVEFDTVSHDIGGDVVTPNLTNNTIEIQKPGVFLLNAQIEFNNPGDGTRCRLLIEEFEASGSFVVSETFTGADNFPTINAVTTLSEQSPPLEIDVETFQDSGGDIQTDSGDFVTFLEVVRLG